MPNSKKVIEWRKRTKTRIVEAMGGKCSACGYSVCFDALELHHLIPEKKNFSMGQIRANPKAWKTIVEELKKCVMLCANCHREVEAGIRHIEHKQYFLDAYAEGNFFSRNFRRYQERLCSVCNCVFEPNSGNQKRCSVVCS